MFHNQNHDDHRPCSPRRCYYFQERTYSQYRLPPAVSSSRPPLPTPREVAADPSLAPPNRAEITERVRTSGKTPRLTLPNHVLVLVGAARVSFPACREILDEAAPELFKKADPESKEVILLNREEPAVFAAFIRWLNNQHLPLKPSIDSSGRGNCTRCGEGWSEWNEMDLVKLCLFANRYMVTKLWNATCLELIDYYIRTNRLPSVAATKLARKRFWDYKEYNVFMFVISFYIYANEKAPIIKRLPFELQTDILGWRPQLGRGSGYPDTPWDLDKFDLIFDKIWTACGTRLKTCSCKYRAALSLEDGFAGSWFGRPGPTSVERPAILKTSPLPLSKRNCGGLR